MRVTIIIYPQASSYRYWLYRRVGVLMAGRGERKGKGRGREKGKRRRKRRGKGKGKGRRRERRTDISVPQVCWPGHTQLSSWSHWQPQRMARLWNLPELCQLFTMWCLLNSFS